MTYVVCEEIKPKVSPKSTFRPLEGPENMKGTDHWEAYHSAGNGSRIASGTARDASQGFEGAETSPNIDNATAPRATSLGVPVAAVGRGQ
jgi:hypothetical protein